MIPCLAPLTRFANRPSRWTLCVPALLSIFLATAACGDSDSGNEANSNPIEVRCAADADGDGVCDDADQCPETLANEPVNAAGCPVRLEAVPWSEGPYGTNIRDTAGDFTLETLDGTVTFSKAWTGEDSWVFFAYEPKVPELVQAWESDALALLKESPANVHYVFFSAGTDPAADVAALKSRFATAVGQLAGGEAWNERLHFVPTPAANLDPVLTSFMSAHSKHRYTARAFAIDRFQRWRQVGMLGALTGQGTAGEMRFLSRIPHNFNYERGIERERAALKPTEVVIADGFVHPGGWEAGNKSRLEATFPSAEEMKGYDSMAIYAFTSCPNHLEGSENGCPAWDMAHHLILCDEADPSSCTTEFVRYITSYHREGEWRTDISALLPLLASGGKRTFEYRGPNSYGLHISIQLWKDPAKTERPIAIQKLWGAAPDETRWDEAYNDTLAPIAFDFDSDKATRVEIVAANTGHGFGSTTENCAEFCNHQHQFTLNGTALSLLEYRKAGTNKGCYERVPEGVVPNQFGTWPFGRAGWCPGQDVKFETVAMGEGIRSGQNTLDYEVLFKKANYSPKYVNPEPTDPYFPHLRSQIWLVTYGAK
jgi:Peptide-N-glycosidase F, C terminal